MLMVSRPLIRSLNFKGQIGGGLIFDMRNPSENVDAGDSLFQVGLELGEKLLKKVDLVHGSDGEELAYKGAMLFFFCKAYKSYQAAELLYKSGYVEDAFILARTVFELALQARYMKEDPKPRARLFTEYDPVARYRYYLRLKELGVIDEIEKFKTHSHQLNLEEMKQYYDRLQKTYPEKKGWWGESIGWLARHLGKETERRYVTIYWMQSNLIHSAAASVMEYLREHEDGLLVNCSPTRPNRSIIPQEITLFFLDIVGQVAEALELKLDDDVSKASEKFRAVLGIA
jgi:hypothetical protein